MDANKALEKLEAIRPGSDDLADPDFADVAEFLNASPERSDEFARRQAWDNRIADAMHEVEVPADAQTRLLDMLNATATTADVSSDAPVQHIAAGTRTKPQAAKPRTRRWLVASLATSAAVLAVATFWMMRSDDAPTFTLAELLQQIPVDAEEIANLSDADDSATKPNAAWRHILEDAKQVTLPSGDKAALFAFKVHSGQFGAISGVVAVIDENALVDPPESDSFQMSENRYISRASKDFATVSWTQGDQVYVCFFAPAGGRRDLEAALYGEVI